MDTIWCLEDSDDSEMVDGIVPMETETIIQKKRFSCFYKTGLSDLLQRSSISALFFAGYAADVCVRFSTMDAYNEGYPIYWLSDCLESAFEPYDQSLRYIILLSDFCVVRANHEACA